MGKIIWGNEGKVDSENEERYKPEKDHILGEEGILRGPSVI